MDTNRTTNEFSKTISPSSLLKRLTRLAEVRQGKAPEDLTPYREALCKFPEHIIDHACGELEKAEVEPYETRFPELGKLLKLCRQRENEVRNEEANTWTLDRYKWAYWFDQQMSERMRDGKTREELLRERPDMAPMWVAWHNQKQAGTLICPAWCDLCEGDGVIVKTPSGEVWDSRYHGKEKRVSHVCRCRYRAGAGEAA